MRRRSIFPKVLKGLVFGVLFVALIGFLVMTLWNWLIPDIFHGPVINFWQALGLCLLGKLLFGWHGHNGGGPWGMRARERWRRKMRERLEHMTPEEKEKLRERFRNCMGRGRGRSRWDNWDWDEERTGEKGKDPEPEKL